MKKGVLLVTAMSSNAFAVPRLLVLLIVSTHTIYCVSARSSVLYSCSIVCGSVLHMQVTSSESRYPHFLRDTLHRPVDVPSLLRDFYSAQPESASGGSSSEARMSMDVLGGSLPSLSCHMAVRRAPASALGLILLRKLFLDRVYS